MCGGCKKYKSMSVEIVPAILRKTFEDIQADWEKIHSVAKHIQIDITDGIFAGDKSFLDLRRLQKLNPAQLELHLMVHTPANFVDDVLDILPARCIFHVESFAGTHDLKFIYTKLREAKQIQLALALNPESPTAWIEEQLPLVNYVLFMGYNPGWANQPINPIVFNKIKEFHAKHKDLPIAVDGHVDKTTVEHYVKSGARILCANTAIFDAGDPKENYEQLRLLAEASVV